MTASRAPFAQNFPALTRAEFDRLAAGGATVAVYRSLLLDGLTPLTVHNALRREGEPSFLFESARGGPRIARYSFVGASPTKTIVDHGGALQSLPDGAPIAADDLFSVLRDDCRRARAVRSPNLPRFCGGWVGFSGWDVARGAIGLGRRAPGVRPAADGLPDAVYHRFDDLVAFDHVQNRVVLIANVSTAHGVDDAWETANRRLDEMSERLVRATRTGFPAPPPVERTWSPVTVEGKLSFEEQVALAKKHLVAGDIFQVVLSRTVSLETEASALSIYRALAAINPSPYLLYFETSGATIVGASPEPLLRVQDGRVHIRPLAGTRPRGSTPEQDRAAEFDLLESEKEAAEHLMLVDLARNDIGRVARLGTVTVDEYRVVERYLHVMHLVSHMSGQLDPAFDRFDAIRASFPAGTMSGAPKRRAVEIIDDLEGDARGLYAGALGYIDLADTNGGVDMCLAIRCLVHRGRKVLIRAGAGIVFDCDPTAERLECEHKAQSLVAAVRLAEAGLDPNRAIKASESR